MSVGELVFYFTLKTFTLGRFKLVLFIRLNNCKTHSRETFSSFNSVNKLFMTFMSIFPFHSCGERDFIDDVIKKAVSSTKEINHKGQGLYATLRKVPGDLKQASLLGGGGGG